MHDAVGRREDQHRSAVAAPAQPLQHLEAVQLGQAEIEDYKVKGVRRQRDIGLGTTADLVGRVTRCAQRTWQAVGQHLVVFGDEDPQSVVSRSKRRRAMVLPGALSGAPSRPGLMAP